MVGISMRFDFDEFQSFIRRQNGQSRLTCPLCFSRAVRCACHSNS
ncbi:hypothetical protein RRSWK_07117 [Rhodopirellula sp. SWK7]|nr:hypothetical protein RRSWK_07117 [Rhodopirellula sp. SWK7]